jgi:FRG domain
MKRGELMREETLQEKAYRALLSPDIADHAKVTFSYQRKLRLIQDWLKHFYGERADWKRCVEKYFSQAKHQKNRVISSTNDMPILKFSDIKQWISEEEITLKCLDKLDELMKTVTEIGAPEKKKLLIQAAKLLGIYPDQTKEEIFYWLIDREGITDEEKQEAISKISQGETYLDLLVSQMSDLFVSGMQVSFPHVGTVMTQRGGRYYFRGENAVYSSSKPGIFRSPNIRPLQNIMDSLVLEEACYFLDQFDAIRYWSPSGINYYALAQHYGIKTPVMDITSDLKTALFFACCKYDNGQWRPLTKKDFALQNSRFGVKDSRYGVVYRSPKEISDMKWALADDMAGYQLITPIGYQPFMRCSAQYGYMFLVKDEHYDMQRDPLFEKYRIELSEELCQWIFDKMDGGQKAFPNDDVPAIEQYMNKIRSTHIISAETFERFALERLHLTTEETVHLRKALQQEGFSVANGRVEHIHYNKLQKINKKYSIEYVISKFKEVPKSRPMLILPSDLEVR